MVVGLSLVTCGLVLVIVFLGYRLRSTREQLNFERDKFHALVNAVPVSISWIDSEYRYVDVNKRLAELVGVSRDDFIGKPVGFNKGEPSYLEFVHSIFDNEEASLSYHFDVCAEGQVHNMLSIAQKYNDGQNAMIIGVDITQQKLAEKIIADQEQALISSARLSALGEMAGAIGHEINNPLSIILGIVDLMKLKMKRGSLSDEDLAKSIAKVESTIERIAQIVSGLQSFAREGSHDPFSKTSMKVIISETVELCSQKAKHNGIELRVLPYDEELVLDCRKVQIQQVLLNLINNAFDAISELPEKWVEVEVLGDAGNIVFRVTDSGGGIDEETEAKIFEPFFTTKGVGKGTGMGLSISVGIITQHQGQLSLDHSSPNTCFVLSLPVVQDSTSTPDSSSGEKEAA